MEWDRDNPLKRAKGESTKANQALHDYARMGLARSLRDLHTQYIQRASNARPTAKWWTLETWSRRYEWQARVARYEQLLQEQELAAFAADRLEWRKKRLDITKAHFGKIARAMQEFDAAGVTLSQLTSAIKTVNEELRKEFGDEVQRVELTGRDGGAVQVQRTEIDYDSMTDTQLEAIVVAARAFREAQDNDA